MTTDSCTIDRYAVAGASLVGISHHTAGTPRQDDFCICPARDGGLAVAVADGLGSRRVSQVGAAMFCLCVSCVVADELAWDASRMLLSAAAQAQSIIDASFASVALETGFVGILLLASTDGVQIARVGDASAFQIVDNGELMELFPAPEGPLNSVDASFPDAGPNDIELVQADASLGPLIVVTDGLALDIRNSSTVRRWLVQSWQEPLGAFAMADTLRYQRQGSLDDRTGVVVWTT